MKRRAVFIRWHDACHVAPGTWCDDLPKSTAVLCTTVGVLIRKTKTHLVVCQTFDDNRSPNVTGVFSIPRSNVVEVRELEFR